MNYNSQWVFISYFRFLRYICHQRSPSLLFISNPRGIHSHPQPEALYVTLTWVQWEGVGRARLRTIVLRSLAAFHSLWHAKRFECKTQDVSDIAERIWGQAEASKISWQVFWPHSKGALSSLYGGVWSKLFSRIASLPGSSRDTRKAIWDYDEK